MSVDDRLRDAFRADEPPEPSVVDHLGVVRAAHRRQVLVRRQVLGAVAVAASVAVLLFVVLGGGEPRTSVPVDGPASPPPSETLAEPVDELQGSWRSRTLTTDDLRGTLEENGRGRWSDRVVADLPPGPWALTLSIQGGAWTLTAVADGAEELLDREIVTADGRRLVISPQFAAGSSTYDYSIRTDGAGSRVLRMVFVETTEGRSNGVPGEAFQRALYTTAVFHELEE